MVVIYRISDTGYKKEKPEYINNQNCFLNTLNIFKEASWWVIADNVGKETKSLLQDKLKTIEHVNVGHGAGTFNLALDYALNLNDQEIVYFVENDYLHRPQADKVLKNGFDLGFDYVTLYDHPDKYASFIHPNPELKDIGENTVVFLTAHSHWKYTNSTTGTFAFKKQTLIEDFDIWMYEVVNNIWQYDYHGFVQIRKNQRKVASCIPGRSSHMYPDLCHSPFFKPDSF